MTETPSSIIIPKENAVFWLDAEGRWHNIHGRFKRKKIIDKFHQSIGKDEDGYFVSQMNCGRFEKVYFEYEDTALFVFRVITDESGILFRLNTGKMLGLDGNSLLVENDVLYLITEEDRIRFAERAIFDIAPLMEEDGEKIFLAVGGRRFPVRVE